MFPGGIADKLGNEYERKWAVRKLLEVIAGNATSMQYEGVSEKFHGFEFALHRPDRVEWHQTKINAPNSNWTLNALKREGVMDAFKRRLSADAAARCVFVSQDPARQMRELCAKARAANNVQEFRGAVSNKDGETFEELARTWDVDKRNAFKWLRRCEFRTESEQSITEAIDMYGWHLLKGDADLFASLSHYLVEKLNAPITTEIAREWIRSCSPFTFLPAALDPTLGEKVAAANQRYLHSYTPFDLAGEQITRTEASNVLAELQAVDGPSLTLLTGEAGSGKSGVVREVMTGLTDSAVPHLAFRIDRYLSCRTRNEVGSVVLDREESPVSALENLAEGSTCVLIVDQIDSVSEVSGRTGAVKDILFELVRETKYYGQDVKCLLVCRSFDLENDPQYRELEREHQAKQVPMEPLSWEDDVAPILERAGVATEGLTEGQRKLLSLLINLSVFLEIDEPDFDVTTSTALMERLLDKKTRDLSRDRNVGWSVQAPLCAMAEWMSNRQELSCPDSTLDDFDGAKDWLSSEGLIVTEQHRLSFFHESFFDFIFARNFAQSDGDIVDFLTSTEQHLFRRTQVRQILTAMRDTDRPRYLEALASVLTHPQIRLHIKHAAAPWLATLDDATHEELKIIQSLDDDGEVFPALMRRALFTGEAWFELLNERGEISMQLESESYSRIRSLLVWLSVIADQRPGTVATLLRNWWKRDPSRNEQLIEWFGFLHQMPAHRSLIALLLDVVHSQPSDLSVDHNCSRIVRIVLDLCVTEPEASAEILRTLFTAWLRIYPCMYLFTDDGSDDIDTLELPNLAEKAPGVFLDVMIPILSKSVQIALEEGPYSNGIPVLYETSAKGGPVALFSLYRDAFCTLAATSPREAESRLDRLDPTLHKVMLHLHLETIGANPAALGHRFEALLDDPHLFTAGLNGAEWKCFADTSRSVVIAKGLPIRTIEERVFRHRPELDEAVKISHEIKGREVCKARSTRRNALEMLARSGHVEWCVLRTIGRDLLSSRGRERLLELERKFSSEKVPTPRSFDGGFIESPIPSAAIHKMTDDNWLCAIRHDRYQRRRPQRGKVETIGGATKIARQLESVTRSDPDRFARFFLRLPDSANSIYGQHVLQGLAGAEQVDEDATIAALRAAHAHRDRPFGLQIVRLIERHPACARDDDVFEAVLWYAAHGEVQDVRTSIDPEPTGKFPSIRDLVPANTALDVSGMNTTRGVAWEVLGQLVKSNPHRAAEIWALVERRASAETSAPVRAMLLHTLVPLYRLDRVRFGACLRRLTGPIAGERDDVSALAPLATHVGIRLFPYIERDLPDLALELMERMIGSSDRTLRLIGAWWALAERLQHGNTTDRFMGIERQSPAHAKLWASILCEFAAHTEYRDMAISELEGLFSHEVPEVQKASADVFRRIPGDEFGHFTDLAQAFIRSPAFEDAAYEIIRPLEKTSHNVTELVLEAGEVIVRDREDGGPVSVYDIETILKREYVNSQNCPELRKRFLDLIDEMAARNLAGADDLMGLDDR